MITKKIIADTMPQALKMVRQQLGDNAIIVNTKTIKKGGLFGLFGTLKYEVTAYSVDKKDEQTHPKYILEPKKMPEKLVQNQKSTNHPARNQVLKMVPVNQPSTDQAPVNKPADASGQTGTGSGFHNKPQNLYSYYAQSSHPAEATIDSPSAAEPTFADSPEMAAENNNSGFRPLTMEQVTVKPPLQQAAVADSPSDSPQTAASDLQPSQPQGNASDEAVLSELQQVRKMMMTMMINERGNTSLPAGLSKWVNRLKKQGVDEEVREHIINRLMEKVDMAAEPDDETIKAEIIAIVADILQQRVSKTNTISDGTRMINIIGPTGVGKTTTIAKLATEQVLKQKRRVAMVTTDVYRIAAVEQLKTYAGILNVPFEVVRSPEELIRVLDNLKHYDLIYMDTTGRNYKELEYRESISGYLQHSFQSDNYLVLSMTTKYEDMEVLLDEFLTSPIQRLIVTKLDETTSYGSILNIAYKYPYELAYMTNGQSVPEDIMTVDAAMLARKLAGEEN